MHTSAGAVIAMLLISVASLAFTRESATRVSVVLPGESRGWDAVQLTRWRLNSTIAETITPRVSRTATSTTVSFDVDCASDSSLFMLVASRLMTAPFKIATTNCESGTVPAPAVFFRAEIQGRALSPTAAPAKSHAWISLNSCRAPDTDSLERFGSYPIEISKTGSWNAVVPAECIQPVLRVDGFGPYFMPALVVGPGVTKDLGEQVLTLGATITFEVSGPGGKVSGARIDLFDASRLSDVVADTISGGSVKGLWSGITDSLGTVTVYNAPEIVTFARVAASTYAPAFTEPVELLPGGNVRSQVYIAPYGSAALRVDPAVLDSTGDQVLSATAVPKLGWRFMPAARKQVEFDQRGLARIEQLLPMTWRFEAVAKSRRSSAVIGIMDVEIRPSTVAAVEFVTANLRYDGTVHIQERGIKALLQFSPLAGTNSAPSESVSDELGRFSIKLLAPGMYSVTVRETPDHAFVVPELLVETGNEIHISIASGAIVGRVTRDGKDAPGVEVSAMLLEMPDSKVSWSTLPVLSTRTDAQGSYVLNGIGAGLWQVIARGERATSRRDVLESAGDRQVRHDIELHSTTRVAGLVVTETMDPVPAAAGVIWADTSSQRAAPTPIQFRTSVNGEFSVDIGAAPGAPVDVVVAPLGRAFSALRVPAGPDMKIPIPTHGGSIRIDFDSPLNPDEPYRPVALISPGGVPVSLDMLSWLNAGQWISGPNGSALVLTNMSPGSWSIVRFESLQAIQRYLAGVTPLPRPVATVNVVAGSRAYGVVPASR